MHNRRTPLLPALVLAAVVPAVAHAQGALDNLQVHGYLTQGFAKANEANYNGMPTDASADYRSAALQFRYAITEKDAAVVQIRHRRIGVGAYAASEPNVELNWAFYQRRIGTAAVKVGKLPMPNGIYNEIRAVGTVLPFYKAPVGVYLEGFETFDGASVANTFDLKRAGSLETQAFGGGFGVRGAASDPATGATVIYNVSMHGLYGGQTWWSTPISGLRVGASAFRYRMADAMDSSKTVDGSTWKGSVDGSFGRVQLRGEYMNSAYGSGMQQGYYVQGGVQVTSKLQLNVQNDFNDQRVTASNIDMKYRAQRDFGVGAAFAVSPSLVLKVEQHDAKYRGSVMSVLMRQAPQRARYTIASVSTAF